jgi:hypothetical protein
MIEHWFWWAVTLACLLWYSTITVYVAFKGLTDIKNMLKRLRESQEQAESMHD